MLLSSALTTLNEALERENLKVILIGGFAVNSYGYSRSTRDVDFLIASEMHQKIDRLMKKLGFSEEIKTDLFVRYVKPDLAIKGIDFVFVEADTFRIISEESRFTKVGDLKFRVPSLNHLIALKLHAVKNGSAHRGFKDLDDIINLMRENRVNPTSKTFKDLCLKYSSKKVYDEILGRLRQST